MAMWSKFFAYTALTKPASEKIIAPSSTVASIDQRVRDVHVGEEHRDQQHDDADQQPAQHAAGDVAEHDHPVRHRATSSSSTWRPNLAPKKDETMLP